MLTLTMDVTELLSKNPNATFTMTLRHISPIFCFDDLGANDWDALFALHTHTVVTHLILWKSIQKLSITMISRQTYNILLSSKLSSV